MVSTENYYKSAIKLGIVMPAYNSRSWERVSSSRLAWAIYCKPVKKIINVVTHEIQRTIK